jgi:hypothetical protein
MTTKSTWNRDQREWNFKVCDNLINSKYNNLEIREILEEGFGYTIDSFLFGKVEDQPVLASTRISILCDDIMDIESWTDERKLKRIEELVEQLKPELIELAKRVKIELQEYEDQLLREARKNNYCKKLLKNM